MHYKIKASGPVIFLLSLTCVTVLAVQLSRPKPPSLHKPYSPRQTQEDPIMTGVELIEYHRSRRIFRTTALKVYYRNKKIMPFGFRIAFQKEAVLEGVETDFYKANNAASRLSSKNATIDMKTKNMVFYGLPALITQERRTLSAEEISWDNSRKELTARGNCTLGAEGRLFKAEEIRADIELKDFVLSGQK